MSDSPYPTLGIGEYTRVRRTSLNLTQPDLARRASISASYVRKIESGLADTPPHDVIKHLATALELTDDQREYLHALAAPAAVKPDDLTPEPLVITDEYKQLIDGLNPTLGALVSRANWDIAYANTAYQQAFPGITEHGNVLEWFFFDDRSRLVMAEWDDEARLTVEWARLLVAEHNASQATRDVIASCSRSPHFIRYWQSLDVAAGRHTPIKNMRTHDTQTPYRLLVDLAASTTYRDHFLYIGVPQPPQ